MVTHSLRGHWVWQKARIDETPSLAASFTSGLQLSEEQGPLVVRLSLFHLLNMFFALLGKELTGMDRRQLLKLLEEWMCWQKFLFYGLAKRYGEGSLLLNIHYEIYFHCAPLSLGNIHDLWKISFSWE